MHVTRLLVETINTINPGIEAGPEIQVGGLTQVLLIEAETSVSGFMVI